MKKILALVVVGVAIKIFLDSAKGQQLKGRIRQGVRNAEDKVNKKLTHVVENAFDKIENTASKIDRAIPGHELN